MVILFAWLLVAHAEEPRGVEEVIVYAQRELEEARRQVEEKILEAGYDRVIERNGRTIYRHERPYMGQLVVDDDGWVVFQRQPVRIDPPDLGKKENSALSWAGCLLWPTACVRVGGQVVSKQKLNSYERRVIEHVQADVEAWNARISDVAIKEKVAQLPEQLDALWEDGRPLQGNTTLATHAERRRALLEFWGSRTDTPWGEEIRAAVEAFCRGVVQHSDHPFTQDEIDAFNARSRAARAFTLDRVEADRPLARPVAP